MDLFFNHSQQKHKNRPKTQLVYKKNGAFTRNNKLDKQVERERESERENTLRPPKNSERPTNEQWQQHFLGQVSWLGATVPLWNLESPQKTRTNIKHRNKEEGL